MSYVPCEDCQSTTYVTNTFPVTVTYKVLTYPVRNEGCESTSGQRKDEMFPCIVSICTRVEEATAVRNISAQKKSNVSDLHIVIIDI
jgi:hypothetical protein